MPGITTHSLALLLPDGSNRWVALFTTPPAPNASGAVEVTAVNYARASHSAWTTAAQVNGSWARSNNGAITFAGFDLPAAAGRIEAVGIYDAATLGNLIFWSRCDQIENIAAADQVRFVTGGISFGSTP